MSTTPDDVRRSLERQRRAFRKRQKGHPLLAPLKDARERRAKLRALADRWGMAADSPEFLRIIQDVRILPGFQVRPGSGGGNKKSEARRYFEDIALAARVALKTEKGRLSTEFAVEHAGESLDRFKRLSPEAKTIFQMYVAHPEIAEGYLKYFEEELVPTWSPSKVT